MDDNRDLFNAIATERVVMTFILFFVMLVAAFGLCSTLITITVQKSREIGLMKALGASDLQVCGVFLLHGTVVGIVGTISGTICGLLLLHYLNHIPHFPDLRLPHPSFLQFRLRPARYSRRDQSDPDRYAHCDVSAVVICILAALVPALGAAKLAPARALRYE